MQNMDSSLKSNTPLNYTLFVHSTTEGGELNTQAERGSGTLSTRREIFTLRQSLK